MKKINKYVIKETIGPFLAGILFFTFIFVIQLLPELIRLIMNNGAPLFIISLINSGRSCINKTYYE